MRNILQYPITTEEKIQTLNSLIEAIDKLQIVGDMRALILEEIVEDLEFMHYGPEYNGDEESVELF